MVYTNIWTSEFEGNHAVNTAILNYECPLAPAIGQTQPAQASKNRFSGESNFSMPPAAPLRSEAEGDAVNFGNVDRHTNYDVRSH
jgi:hypothetical protein